MDEEIPNPVLLLYNFIFRVWGRNTFSQQLAQHMAGQTHLQKTSFFLKRAFLCVGQNGQVLTQHHNESLKKRMAVNYEKKFDLL